MDTALPKLKPTDTILIARSALLGGLPEAVRASVLAHCQVRTLNRGTHLFLQGDGADMVYLVLEGWLKVFRLSSDGAEAVLHIFRPGESLAEPAVFSLGRYPASAEAAAPDTRVLAIPGNVLRDMLRRDPELALQIIGVFSQRMNSLVAETERRQVLPTVRRVATFLLELLDDTQATLLPPPHTLTLPYDKALIAARLGMTPESLSRALAQLKRQGVSVHGARVRFEDSVALRRYAEGMEK